MDWTSLLFYSAVAGVAFACHRAARFLPVGPTLVTLAVGLVLGRTGFQLLEPMAYQKVLPAIVLHVSVILGALGFQLGLGMLRQPVHVILRRSLPAALAGGILIVAAAFLVPRFLADAFPQREFLRFDFPLACVLAVLPMLALRDLRGRPPTAGGSHFLVATMLIGAVNSFAPHLLWAPVLDPTMLWRAPLLVLGESGALGVALGVIYLFLSRRLGLPRGLVLAVVAVTLVETAVRTHLWVPISAIGFGIVLGRAGERPFGLPAGGRWLFAETPFLLIATLTFAPDLFLDEIAGPALAYAAGTAALLLAVRAWHPRGQLMVTGPGLLFLGLTLMVRLDGRMSPLSRYVIDFALPTWAVTRLALEVARRRTARRAAPAPESSRV